jgi:hypothetical protein
VSENTQELTCKDCPHWLPGWGHRPTDIQGHCKHPLEPWNLPDRVPWELRQVTLRDDLCLIDTEYNR